MTVEDLLAIPGGDGWRYELVEGVLFRAAGSGKVDRTKPILVAPDLAVEVTSPTQNASDMAAKARRYLQGGTRLVWLAWPERHQIAIWRAGALAPAATLGPDDTIDGEDVVPGFAVPVAELFAGPLD